MKRVDIKNYLRKKFIMKHALFKHVTQTFLRLHIFVEYFRMDFFILLLYLFKDKITYSSVTYDEKVKMWQYIHFDFKQNETNRI